MACNHNCSSCGACSRGASPAVSLGYSSGSSPQIFANEIYSCAGHSGGCSSYSSHSSASSGSYSGSSGSFGSAYSSSLESVVSGYQGSNASSSGDYSAISASMSNQSYAIDLDSIVVPVIYQNNQNSHNNSHSVSENRAYENKINVNSAAEGKYSITSTPGMNFSPSPFLKKNRPYTMFVGDAYEIQDWIKEAFRATTGNELPLSIIIEVCNKERFIGTFEAFGGVSSSGLQGFAINKNHIGDDSLVFIVSGPLDKVMLTIGHEIGHLMSIPLADKKAEEAKAFAFSIAWMKAIKKNNIAGLADSIELDEPARNGLHDVALEFVFNTIETGRDAMDVFGKLASTELSLNAA